MAEKLSRKDSTWRQGKVTCQCYHVGHDDGQAVEDGSSLMELSDALDGTERTIMLDTHILFLKAGRCFCDIHLPNW